MSLDAATSRHSRELRSRERPAFSLLQRSVGGKPKGRLIHAAIIVFVLGLVSVTLQLSRPSELRLLYTVDFDGSPLGRYNEPEAQRDWYSRIDRFSHGEGYASIVSDRGDHVLRIMQPAGTVGASPGWKLRLPGSYEAAMLRYQVRFGKTFEFGKKGGKLPGLSGQRVNQPPCSPRDGTDEFLGRLMWKFEHPGEDGRGQLQVYSYHPDKNSVCGEAERVPAFLEPDRWYEISIYIRMNQPGASDGLLVLHVDGQEVYRRSDFRWRSSLQGDPPFGIDTINWTSYFGGKPNKGWEHNRDEYIFYDDVEVYAGERTFDTESK